MTKAKNVQAKARLKRLLKKGKLQIPRTSSPRKRGYGRLGMTKVEDLPARLKTRPDTDPEFFINL